jgi:tetratricopeptide (TPR) repeat protein
MLHNKFERIVHDFVTAGALGDEVISALVPGGRFHDFESWVFDYKTGYHLSTTIKSPDLELAELIKDFVAFHNSMGGYVLITYPDSHPAPAIVSILNNTDDVLRRLASYAGTLLPIRFYKCKITVDDVAHTSICVFIPKRPATSKPVAFAKNSPNKGDQAAPSYIFKKNDIYVRRDFECIPANNDLELLSFVFSERSATTLLSLPITTENNLPLRDPNLIRFVGRKQYLEDLWAWLADYRSPIRVLTASGGIGKTAVAYEFASQVVDQPGASLEKVVWLSGKKITYSGLRGKLEPTTRCDFSDINTFLDALLLHIGHPKSLLDSLIERDDKIDCVIESLSVFGILLVVDDVDSLEKDGQRDLFSILSHIAIKANHVNKLSRVLFTSRLELFTGADQRMPVEGFIGDEFVAFLEMMTKYFIKDQEISVRIMDARDEILGASGGSAIFILSIVRLVSLGHDLTKSIEEWKGKKGELVRAFAFQREIQQLSQPQREILYAIQLLSRARIEEIQEICGITSNEIDEELGALREYHLYSVKENAISGTVLEVPEPIRLMYDITGQSIISARRSRIENACARVRHNEEDPGRTIGVIISQTTAYWKSGAVDVAIAYLNQEIRKYNKSGELYSLRAKSKMMLGSKHFAGADDDFATAEKYNCDKLILLRDWCSLKIQKQDWRGLQQLIERISDSERYPIICLCLVFAIMKRGEKAAFGKSFPDAINLYSEAIKKGADLIEENKISGRYFQLRDIMRACAYNVVVIRKESQRVEEKREIFEFVRWCISLKFGPTLIIREGFAALESWLREFHVGRSISGTTRRRVRDGLYDIRRYLTSQENKRVKIIARCDSLISTLDTVP